MIHEFEFARLRNALTVDPNALDDDLINIAMQQMEIAEYTAEAAKKENEMDFQNDQVIADVSAKLRESDNKMSEARIKSELHLYDEVLSANTELVEAKFDHARWKGLADAIRTKSSSIRAIADLISSGYMTSNTIRTDRRELIHQHRQQQSSYAQSGGTTSR